MTSRLTSRTPERSPTAHMGQSGLSATTTTAHMGQPVDDINLTTRIPTEGAHSPTGQTGLNTHTHTHTHPESSPQGPPRSSLRGVWRGHFRVGQRHVDGLNAGRTQREFSFVLYLNKGWTESNRGYLRVYDTREVRSTGPQHGHLSRPKLAK